MTDKKQSMTSNDGHWSRRDFLKMSAMGLGVGAFGGLVPGWMQSAAFAAPGGSVEKSKLTFGFIPLTDCAPIVIAAEKGYFKKHGLDVAVSKEASWANIRDKVTTGVLDGAHMLSPMPLASSLGVGAIAKPMMTPFSMDLNGNAITVSNKLFERMVEADPEAMKEKPISAKALKKVIDADKAVGKDPMTFASVFPVSTHFYQLRYWMASAGIDPDNDVRMIVIPPPQMVANLNAGNMDGYCVGEPWNERAVEMGIGHVLITSYEIWNNNPEKVFGFTQEFADQNPNTVLAATMAMMEANQWMDDPANRPEVVKILSRREFVNAPEDVIKMSMTGTFRYNAKADPVPMPDFNVFHRYAATFPWVSRAEWFLAEMIRWGQIGKPINLHAEASKVFRPDIYRQAAKQLGWAYPTIDRKVEGAHKDAWSLTDASSPIAMGPDKFFDGSVFDPKDPVGYLKSLKVKNMKFSLEELAKANA